MRLLATTRRPASSSILVTAPVRLRRVASGLMIEKVRVTAMGSSLRVCGRFARAPSGGVSPAQGSRAFDPAPAFLLPEVPLYIRALAQRSPGAARRVDRAAVEE